MEYLNEVSALYAVYAKKETGRTFSVPGASANGLGNRTSFTVSVAGLLESVKNYFLTFALMTMHRISELSAPKVSLRRG